MSEHRCEKMPPGEWFVVRPSGTGLVGMESISYTHCPWCDEMLEDEAEASRCAEKQAFW